MHWVLVATVICTFCSKSYSAPQDSQDGTRVDSSRDFYKKDSQITIESLVKNESENPTKNGAKPLIVGIAAFKEEPEVAAAGPEKPVEVTTETTLPTNKPIVVKPSKKPLRITTLKPADETIAVTNPVPVTPSTTANPDRRYPCKCGGGLCSCCTGLILENFNVPFRPRACANVTYEPDEFAFNFKLLFNNRVLYKTRMSAKNPRPVCVPINRYFGVKMCAKLSNIYMSGHNIHACLDMEGYWDDESAFNYSFNCFRIGSSGVGFVSPEEGGGLPPPPDEEEQTDEDYDDSARAWTGDVEEIPS